VPVESKTGRSPRTPSIVLRAHEPKPMNEAPGKSCSDPPGTSAPFRLLPIRAPRQTVLRTSSGLAPSFTTSLVGLTVKKTRDASNRCLPPIRITCTRTSRVPDSLRWLPSAEAPRSLRLRTAIRGIEWFTTLETASADRHCVLTSSSNPSRAGDTSVGVFFPRHSGDRASDTPVANLSLHPQRFVELPRRCLLLRLGRSPAFLRVGADRRMRRLAKTIVSAVS